MTFHYDRRSYYKTMTSLQEQAARDHRREPEETMESASARAISQAEQEGRVSPKEIDEAVETAQKEFRLMRAATWPARRDAVQRRYLREMRMRRGESVCDEWVEGDHPRKENGEFTFKGTGSASGSAQAERRDPVEREKPAPSAGNRPVSAWRRDRTESPKALSPESREEYRQSWEQMRLTQARESGSEFRQNRLLSEASQVKFASTLLKALNNFPGSGIQFVGDLLSAVLSPVETGKGIIRIIAGYACQITGNESEYRVYSEAVTQYFMERYGSMEKFIETLEEDPVGLAADVSLFFTAGAGALKILAKGGTVAARALPTGSRAAQGIGTAAGAVEKGATAAGAVGSTLDPLNIPGKVMGKAALSFTPPQRWELLKKYSTPLSRLKNAAGTGGTQKSIERGQENKR